MAWDPTKPGSATPADADLVFGANQSAKNIRDKFGETTDNFAAINTAWQINHQGIGASNEGKHKAINIREVGTPATATQEVAIWATDPALTTDGTELYIRRENNGSSWPFTAARRNSTDGWTVLPSGIMFKWNQVTAGNAGLNTETFPVSSSYPVFAALYQVQITIINSATGSDSDDAVRVVDMSTTQFRYYSTPRATTGTKSGVQFMYLAIGSIY